MIRPSIISLCCGAGLAALGYEKFFNTMLAVDNWWWAYLSHLANHFTTPILWEDVGDNDVIQHVCAGVANIRGVIAAPPCPTFSTANGLTPQQRALDPRGWVYVKVLDYIARLRPDFYICENVVAAKNSFQFLVATARLERLDYEWDAWVLDAADFGVPQHRARLFLVAVKKGMKFPTCPIPTHGPAGSGLLPYLTLGDAIGDLTEEESVASGHRKLSYRRTRILSKVPPGGNYCCLPTDLGTLRTGPECKQSTFPIHPVHPFNKIQADGKVRFGGGRRPALLEPSPTLRTDPCRDCLIRPDVTRCLSVLEYLRIQGIRTPFRLHGSVLDCYRQVGNGIPPLLMEKVCEAVYRAVYAASTPSPIQVSHEVITVTSVVSAPVTKTEQTAVPRPPLRYYGGKWRLAPWILSHLPKHDVYVEPFSGSASVLLRKEPSRIEVFNDIDAEVVNLFRILRDSKQAAELAKLITLTPFSVQEFEAAYDDRPCDEPLERARRLLVRSDFGYGCVRPDRNGFRRSMLKCLPDEWATKPDALLCAAERLKHVVLESMDALACIKKYDSPGTLFYCDPPYVHKTRSVKKVYAQEMTDADHERLVHALNGVKGQVVLSGYDCPLYDRILTGWRREELQTRNNRQRPTTEMIWIKPVVGLASVAIAGDHAA